MNVIAFILFFQPQISFPAQTISDSGLRDFQFAPMVGRYQYAEDFYELHTLGIQSDSIALQNQLRYMHLAAQAPFRDPRYALAEIRTRDEYRLYQYVIYFSIGLRMTKMYMQYAARYDKPDVYWYDTAQKEIWGKSFSRALRYYRMAHYYWQKTKTFAALAYARRITRLVGAGMDNLQALAQCVVEAEKTTRLNKKTVNDPYRNKYLDCRIGKILNDRVNDLERKTKELGQPLESPEDWKAVAQRQENEFKNISSKE